MNETKATIAIGPGTLDGLPASMPFSADGQGGVAGGVPCAVAPAEGAVPVTLDTVAWRYQGKPRITIVMKASLSLGASPMTAAEKGDPFRTRDAHHRGRPVAHVVGPSDRVPYRKSVDVTLLGTAEAPGGQALAAMNVRLAVAQRGAFVLDKSLRVVGKRASHDGAPEPFTRMPVTYERAVGGLASSDNPIGCDEDDEPANILHASDPKIPAGLGPIGAAWPARTRRVRDDVRRKLDEPVIDLPADFDWQYFQVAPDDQRIAAIVPGTTILLEGFSEARPSLQAALPDLRPAGAIFGLDEATDTPSPLGFHPDGLHIDADRMTCVITYRCHIELRDEAQRPRLRVVAGVGLGAAPVIGDAPPEAPTASIARSPSGAPPRANAGATLDIAADGAPPRTALPFDDPGAKARVDAKARAGARAQLEKTSVLPGGMPFAPAAAPSMPFAPTAAPSMPFAPAQMARPGSLSPLTTEAPPAPPAIAPSQFFHDASRLPGAGGLVPRVRDLASGGLAGPGDAPFEAPAAPARELAPAEKIPLERHAALTAELEERDARPYQVLGDHDVDEATWKKADRHWRKAIDDDLKLGRRDLRDLHDDAYVRAWEARHPGVFGAEQYARLTVAEQRGLLSHAVGELGLGSPLGMRLKRVFRRRVARDPVLSAQIDAATRALSGT